ncbi:MAG TPA: hypothetical protein VK817_23820 [Trebonia sp.]|nr:hypothetical protein [Trebonia sp.]
MLVVIVIVALVVLAVVVYAATGRGGELPIENNDYAPLDLGPVSATDVVLLRPPTALWGYSVQATDEALERIAESIRDRDVRIVALEQLVTDLSRDHTPQALSSPPPYMSARHRREDFTPPDLPAVLPLPPENQFTPTSSETQFTPVPPKTQFTSVPPTTTFTPVAQDMPVTPMAPPAPATQENRADGEPGVPGVPDATSAGDAGAGERQRERGVGGGGLPPERSHG